MTSILIMGGGVSGLTAATLLRQKGFTVTVVEKKEKFGGQFTSGRTTHHHPTAHSVRIIDKNHYVCFLNIIKQIPYKDTTVDKNLVVNPVRVLYKRKIRIKDNMIILLYKKKRNFIFHHLRLIRSQYFLIKYSIDFLSYVKSMLRFFYLIALPKKLILKHVKNGFKAKNNLFTNIVSGVTGNPRPNDLAIASYLHAQMSMANGDAASFNGPVTEKCIDPWVSYCKSIGIELFNHTQLDDLQVNETLSKVEKADLYNTKTKEKVTLAADEYILAVPQFVAKKYKKYFFDFTDSQNVSPNILMQFYLKDLPKQPQFKPGQGCMSIDVPGSYVFIVEGKDFWDNTVDMGDECKYVLSISCGAPLVPSILRPHKRVIDCTKEELYEEYLLACQFTDKELISGWHLDSDYHIVDESTLRKDYDDAPIKIKRADGNYAIHLVPLDILDENNIFPKNNTLLHNLTLAGVYTDNDYYIISKERAARSGYLAAIEICKKYEIPYDDIQAIFSEYDKKNIFRRIIKIFV
jgi:NAD(P)-binding Rossmann-like domain